MGTIFHDGITESKYHDTIEYKQIEIDNHKCELTSDLVIKPSMHQIGWSKDYAILLDTLDRKDIDLMRLL